MPLAVITGATGGLGLRIAELLARKYEILLVARGESTLREIADRLRAAGAKADYVAADLGTQDGVARVVAAVEQRGGAEVLVNNAGFGNYGAFWESDIESEGGVIRLNIEAVARLTRAVLPGMTARRRGTVINVASTAGFQPVPYFAVYAATKAFVVSFSEACSAELLGQGFDAVKVVALCPGPMETGFQARAGVKNEEYGGVPFESVESVAAKAVAIIDGGRWTRITGLLGRLTVLSLRFTPRAMVARVAQAMFRPRGERPKAEKV